MKKITKKISILAKTFPTQGDFAEKVGVAQATVSDWLSGKGPGTRSAFRIATAIGIPPECLIDDDMELPLGDRREMPSRFDADHFEEEPSPYGASPHANTAALISAMARRIDALENRVVLLERISAATVAASHDLLREGSDGTGETVKGVRIPADLDADIKAGLRKGQVH